MISGPASLSINRHPLVDHVLCSVLNISGAMHVHVQVLCSLPIHLNCWLAIILLVRPDVTLIMPHHPATRIAAADLRWLCGWVKQINSKLSALSTRSCTSPAVRSGKRTHSLAVIGGCDQTYLNVNWLSGTTETRRDHQSHAPAQLKTLVYFPSTHAKKEKGQLRTNQVQEQTNNGSRVTSGYSTVLSRLSREKRYRWTCVLAENRSTPLCLAKECLFPRAFLINKHQKLNYCTTSYILQWHGRLSRPLLARD